MARIEIQDSSVIDDAMKPFVVEEDGKSYFETSNIPNVDKLTSALDSERELKKKALQSSKEAMAQAEKFKDVDIEKYNEMISKQKDQQEKDLFDKAGESDDDFEKKMQLRDAERDADWQKKMD